MRPSLTRFRVAALLTGALARCSSGSGPDLSMCSGPVTFTFVASPTPTFSWSPNCLVDHVLVEEPLPPSFGGFHFMWQITARAEVMGAAAPLEYGAVPESMQENIAAEPLQVAHSYRARIYANEVLVGERGFTYSAPD